MSFYSHQKRSDFLIISQKCVKIVHFRWEMVKTFGWPNSCHEAVILESPLVKCNVMVGNFGVLYDKETEIATLATPPTRRHPSSFPASTVSTSKLAVSSCRWQSVQPASPRRSAFVDTILLLPSQRKSADGRVASRGASRFTLPGYRRLTILILAVTTRRSPGTWPDQNKSYC